MQMQNGMNAPTDVTLMEMNQGPSLALGVPLVIPAPGDVNMTEIPAQFKMLMMGLPNTTIASTRMTPAPIIKALSAPLIPGASVNTFSMPPPTVAPKISTNTLMKGQVVFALGQQVSVVTSKFGPMLHMTSMLGNPKVTQIAVTA